jgi:hypothetical protein
MTSYGVKAGHAQTSCRATPIVMASLLAVLATGHVADAASSRSERAIETAARAAGEPMMAIVSLRDQRVTIYDANGWILRARVSSGQKGRETPAGIFSIIQKEAEHYSNLYDDAYMPHMLRITWSGIALHGGIVPKYPASHGCVRMPYDFAEQLFDMMRLGTRIIIAPTDVAPVTIAHPALFPPKPGAAAAAAARAAEAAEAAAKADQARRAVMAATQEAARAMVPVRKAENLKLRAEAQLADAQRALAAAASDAEKEQATEAKAKAAAWLADLETQLAAAKAALQPKLDALPPAREAAVEAEKARQAAADAARQATRDLEPVSVFISRKTQRLYLRQAFQPILDVPITIRDADRPIGTHVFTAMERIGGDAGLRWSVVSLHSEQADGTALVETNSSARGIAGHDGQTISADGPKTAKAALDRITIPQDTFDLIASKVSPRSALIISDEALSPETGNGTEFVVVLSGEPQGGLKNRRRSPDFEVRFDRPSYRSYWRWPYAGRYSTW